MKIIPKTIQSLMLALVMIGGAAYPSQADIHVAQVLGGAMDPRVAPEPVLGGTVTLDLGRKVLTVALKDSITVTLPVVGSYQESCEEMVYVARRDLRTTGGDLEQMELHDDSRSGCAEPGVQTQIIYETSGHGIDTRSVIDAAALMPQL